MFKNGGRLEWVTCRIVYNGGGGEKENVLKENAKVLFFVKTVCFLCKMWDEGVSACAQEVS